MIFLGCKRKEGRSRFVKEAGREDDREILAVHLVLHEAADTLQELEDEEGCVTVGLWQQRH